VKQGETRQGKGRGKTEKFHNEFLVRNYMFERLKNNIFFSLLYFNIFVLRIPLTVCNIL